MNCIKAEKLMMSYMDNTLSENDAKKLNEHIKICEDCKEAFFVYEMMQDSLENAELVEAPDGFEQNVMSKISSIVPDYLTKENISVYSIQSVVWGLFTIFFGAGIMLNMYSQPIMNYISQNEYIAKFYDTVTPISNLISNYINEIFLFLQNTVMSMNGLITYSKILFGVLVVLLCCIQVWIKRKDKVDA